MPSLEDQHKGEEIGFELATSLAQQHCHHDFCDRQWSGSSSTSKVRLSKEKRTNNVTARPIPGSRTIIRNGFKDRRLAPQITTTFSNMLRPRSHIA